MPCLFYYVAVNIFSKSRRITTSDAPASSTSTSPVIVAILLAPPNVSVIPSSKVCAALRTIVPLPFTAPAPLSTVGIAAETSIPTPVTVLTLSLIPALSSTVTFVLLLTTPSTVVVTGVNSTFKLLNLRS